MARTTDRTLARRLVDRLLSLFGAVGLTALFFLLLPLIQAITKERSDTLELVQADTAALPPPPPPPEPEAEPDPPPEPEPPAPTEQNETPLDLSQLELALNPGFSGGWMGGDFAVNLGGMAQSEDQVDALFSLADLDQKPRCVWQPAPALTAKLRKLAPATVYVLFVVDQDGRVDAPRVQRSTNPEFDRAAVNAVKQWKFEPGKRNGQPVRFRMRVPITFPKA